LATDDSTKAAGDGGDDKGERKDEVEVEHGKAADEAR
jgi:hypothetical protein